MNKFFIVMTACIFAMTFNVALAKSPNGKGHGQAMGSGNSGGGYGNTGPGNQGNSKESGNAGGNVDGNNGDQGGDSGDNNNGSNDDDRGTSDGKRSGVSGTRSGLSGGGSSTINRDIDCNGFCHCDYALNYWFDKRCKLVEDIEPEYRACQPTE